MFIDGKRRTELSDFDHIKTKITFRVFNCLKPLAEIGGFLCTVLPENRRERHTLPVSVLGTQVQEDDLSTSQLRRSVSTACPTHNAHSLPVPTSVGLNNHVSIPFKRATFTATTRRLFVQQKTLAFCTQGLSLLVRGRTISLNNFV